MQCSENHKFYNIVFRFYSDDGKDSKDYYVIIFSTMDD